MKTFRIIGVVIMTILMSVGFASCSSDKDDNGVGDGNLIVGKWIVSESSEYTTVIEFKADGSYISSVYEHSDLFFEGKGLYVYSNSKLTVTSQSVREFDNGEWSEWRKYVFTNVFEVTFNGNQLFLTNSDGIRVLERK